MTHRVGRKDRASNGPEQDATGIFSPRGDGGRLVYFDHQATTPLDPRVLEAMLPWLRDGFGNPHVRTHKIGEAAHTAVEEARCKIARLIGAESDEIIFQSGATEACNLALRGLIHEGGRAVTSTIEHSCIIETLKSLRDVQTSFVSVSEEGLVAPDDIDKACKPGAAVVSVMTVNNETGVIQPIAEIGSLCRRLGVPFHTDAAQALGKIPIDVKRDNIDLLSMSSHKIYGPQGIGALFCRSALQTELQPILTGGGQERGLRAGTLPTALCVGFGYACEIAGREMSWDASRIGGLRDQFLGRLSDQVDGISINGSMDFRLPGNLNIAIAGIDADSLIARLPDVAISTGSACNSGALESSHVLRAMGLDQETLDGSVRIGIGRTSTSDEVDYAVCRLVTEIKYLRRAAKVPAESRTGEAAVPIRMRKTTSAPRKVRRRAGGR